VSDIESDIESDAEFQATDAAYRAWCADYGHKLPSNGLGRHLFWAGWLAGRDWQRSQTGAAERAAALVAAIKALAAFAVLNDNGYSRCRVCEGWWHTGDRVRHASDCPVLTAATAGRQDDGG